MTESTHPGAPLRSQPPTIGSPTAQGELSATRSSSSSRAEKHSSSTSGDSYTSPARDWRRIARAGGVNIPAEKHQEPHAPPSDSQLFPDSFREGDHRTHFYSRPERPLGDCRTRPVRDGRAVHRLHEVRLHQGQRFSLG